MNTRPIIFRIVLAAIAVGPAASAQTTNYVASPVSVPALPDAGASLFRVAGALALVIGIFFAGVWIYRNWQRVLRPRAQQPKLNVLEVRSLGGKHALYVVGYESERFLLASSPTGVNLVSQLAPADPAAAVEAEPAAPGLSFAEALTRVLKGTPAPGGKTGGTT